MTFAIHTFGCKVNIYESEYVINLMQANGYTMVDFDSEADIYASRILVRYNRLEFDINGIYGHHHVISHISGEGAPCIC